MKRFLFTLYIESGTNYVDHVSSNEFVIFTLISFQKSVIVKWTLESLRNGDGTTESVYIRKEFNSHRIGSEGQHFFNRDLTTRQRRRP